MTIKITNFYHEESVNISLPLVIGEITAAKDGNIHIQNLTTSFGVIHWPVINGKFKVLVPLIKGKNEIKFEFKTSIINFTLVYKPLINKRFVRLVYIKCRDDPGLFQAPDGENNSIQSACNRISLAALLLQTFTADKLHEHNLSRKTFRLEEINNKVLCHVFTSSLTLSDAHNLNDQELWSHFAVELMNSKLRIENNCKFLAFLSFTRYINNSNQIPLNHKEVMNLTKAHVALGGGGLALFGSACLHTWAENVQEIPWRFGDKRRIDRLKLMDDSANRGFYWACFSTGLGAALHELGHTFDLGHTDGGIMGRGFDDIHKYYIIDMFYHDHMFQKEYNPFYQKHKNSVCTVDLTLTSPIDWMESSKQSFENIQAINKSSEVPWQLPNPPDSDLESGKYAVNVGGAYWSRSSALILYFHKWFNDVEETEKVNTISFQGTKVMSPNGVKVIEFRDQNGTSFHHLEFLDEDIFEIDLISCNLSQHIPENVSNISALAEDRLGNIIKSKLEITLFASIKN